MMEAVGIVSYCSNFIWRCKYNRRVEHNRGQLI